MKDFVVLQGRNNSYRDVDDARCDAGQRAMAVSVAR